MASSDNLISMDPSWIFRTPFPDTYFPDTFSIETETFAKALQRTFETQDFSCTNFPENSISPPYPNSQPISPPYPNSQPISPRYSNSQPISPPYPNSQPVSPPYPNSQPISPSSTDSAISSGVITSNKRKISNRKPRASKREKTTFINADAANFRRLVQDFTGVKFGNGNGVVNGSQLVKPEPHRMSQLQMIGSLPTLDTSSFLLDIGFKNKETVAEGVAPPLSNGGRGCMDQFDFDSFCSFPTLESWKAV